MYCGKKKSCRTSCRSALPLPQLQVAPSTSLSETTLSTSVSGSTSGSQLASVHHGGFVALKLKKYEDEEPQIAQVVDIDGKMLTIDWWIGSYTANWVPWKIRGVQQIEKISEDAVLRPISMNKSNRLTKELINDLRSLYSNCTPV